jgi:hypothetical protein
MRGTLGRNLRVFVAVTLCLWLSSAAFAQHGGGHGGGGRGGGVGGHAHGITRFPPFRAARLFGRRHRRRFEEPFRANDLFVGGFADCGFWDWDCGFGGYDGYFGNWAYQPPSSGSANAPPVTVLYLNNGYSVGVRAYWLENGWLHYLTTYGGENSVPAGEIDLQRTVDENAKNNVPFVLRPRETPHLPPEEH